MVQLVSLLLILNGIYDIFSATDILTYDYWKFHTNLFNQTKEYKDLLGFWILTYGIVRLFAGLNYYKDGVWIVSAAATYYLEFEFYRKINSFVSLTCLSATVYLIFLDEIYK